eukprot:jgi/Mesen1/2042/ME000149S01041
MPGGSVHAAAGGRRSRRSGLSFAVAGDSPSGSSSDAADDVLTSSPRQPSPLTLAQVSLALRRKLGFTLELKPSLVPHREAGEGLFIAGRAGPGTVLSLYPGVVYAPAQYKFMPDYPRVDRDNPYLMSRYDGVVIDGKSWGRGGDRPRLWSGLESDDYAWYVEKMQGLEWTGGAAEVHGGGEEGEGGGKEAVGRKRTGAERGEGGDEAATHGLGERGGRAGARSGGSQSIEGLRGSGAQADPGVEEGAGTLHHGLKHRGGEEDEARGSSNSSRRVRSSSSSRPRTVLELAVGKGHRAAAAMLARTAAHIERRNPLALAHFANHPAEGGKPNVMVCAFDFYPLAALPSFSPSSPSSPSPPSLSSPSSSALSFFSSSSPFSASAALPLPAHVLQAAAVSGGPSQMAGLGPSVVENTFLLRPYIPNTIFDGGLGGDALERSGLLWVHNSDSPRQGPAGDSRSASQRGLWGIKTGAVIRTLVLVATREVEDEEILLNYRLSSPVGLPQWYSPVDADEDRRRWA